MDLIDDNGSGRFALPAHAGLAPPDDDAVARLRPDRRFAVAGGGQILACCSVWRDSLPPTDGGRPAAIGQFACVDAPAGGRLLEGACEWLADRGAVTVVGPVDANTWHRYRLVTWSDGRPPFLLEPDHPEHFVDAWRGAGFTPFAEYHSTEMPPQTTADPRLARVERRLQGLGVRIRNLSLDDYEADLRRLYAVSRASFAGNLLYTPVSETDFLGLYLPLRDLVRPEFVWLAEQADTCVGFYFCIPDLNQAASGKPVDALIGKTLAVLPGRAWAGLGNLLARIAHRGAAEAGFRTVIHALMHPGSRIKHFGGDQARVVRRYTLFQRGLRQP